MSTPLQTLAKRAHIKALALGCTDQAEDVAQDVVVKFLEHGTGQTIDQAVIDALRKLRGRTIGKQEQNKVSAARDIPSHGKLALDFDRIISCLTPRARCATILFYVWGFTTAEIAYALGTSVQSVGVLLHTARQKMKALTLEGS